MELDDLINTFESKTKNKKDRFKEFCAHCWYVFDKQIKSTKSDKMINKYNTMRQKTINYIVANENDLPSTDCLRLGRTVNLQTLTNLILSITI